MASSPLRTSGSALPLGDATSQENARVLTDGSLPLDLSHTGIDSRGVLRHRRPLAFQQLCGSGGKNVNPDVRDAVSGVVAALARWAADESGGVPSAEQVAAARELVFVRLSHVPRTLFSRLDIGPPNSPLERLLHPELARCHDRVGAFRRRHARAMDAGNAAKAARYAALVDMWSYRQAVAKVRFAIMCGVHPVMIEAGTSGSYFVKDRAGTMVAVFKPKSEEPYAPANPKFGKKVQKVCCPCMFGRSFLLSDTGYLSEAGGSLVDRALGLAMVPRTEVVELASPVFNNILHKALKFMHIRLAGASLPVKRGSFQLFLHGFIPAREALKIIAAKPLPPAAYDSFVHQFQRLIIVDYLIRNTDRNLDNWLVKIDDRGASDVTVQVQAIDNGLAFPIRHPDGYRKFPYEWAVLPFARDAFLDDMAEYAERLADQAFLEDLMAQLYYLFLPDPGFTAEGFEGQMSVLSGQAANLVRCIRSRGSPADLAAYPPQTRQVRLSDLEAALARAAGSPLASAPGAPQGTDQGSKATAAARVVHRLIPGEDGSLESALGPSLGPNAGRTSTEMTAQRRQRRGGRQQQQHQLQQQQHQQHQGQNLMMEDGLDSDSLASGDAGKSSSSTDEDFHTLE